jgi:alanyl-tRNA synthetase
MFSLSLDETPAAVAAQLESVRAAEKHRRKLEAELAGYQGRELYDATASGSDGTRRILRRVPSGSLDDFRGIAQSFTARDKAVYIAVVDEPPALLLAVSGDSGVDAGKVMKSAAASLGGRGGGNQRIAQGSVPSRDALEELLRGALKAAQA